MSEHDETGPTAPEPPEFIAVTPRGIVPEPPQAPTSADDPAPADEPETGPDAPEPGPEAEAPADTAVEEPRSPAAPGPAPPAAEVETDEPPRPPTAETEPDADPAATPQPQAVPAAAAPITAAEVGADDVSPELPDPEIEPEPEWVPEPAVSGTRVDRIRLATVACVVLALAAGTLLAISAHSASDRRAVAAARVAALAAAKRETGPFLSYDYRTFDQDVRRAEAGMSAKFRANYAQTQATQVKALALKNHSSSKATVVAAGVESASATRAKVLVFADQVVQNTLLQATSRLDQDQIELFMVKEGGRWVIDDVHPF